MDQTWIQMIRKICLLAKTVVSSLGHSGDRINWPVLGVALWDGVIGLTVEYDFRYPLCCGQPDHVRATIPLGRLIRITNADGDGDSDDAEDAEYSKQWTKRRSVPHHNDGKVR